MQKFKVLLLMGISFLNCWSMEQNLNIQVSKSENEQTLNIEIPKDIENEIISHIQPNIELAQKNKDNGILANDLIKIIKEFLELKLVSKSWNQYIENSVSLNCSVINKLIKEFLFIEFLAARKLWGLPLKGVKKPTHKGYEMTSNISMDMLIAQLIGTKGAIECIKEKNPKLKNSSILAFTFLENIQKILNSRIEIDDKKQILNRLAKVALRHLDINEFISSENKIKLLKESFKLYGWGQEEYGQECINKTNKLGQDIQKIFLNKMNENQKKSYYSAPMNIPFSEKYFN